MWHRMLWFWEREHWGHIGENKMLTVGKLLLHGVQLSLTAATSLTEKFYNQTVCFVVCWQQKRGRVPTSNLFLIRTSEQLIKPLQHWCAIVSEEKRKNKTRQIPCIKISTLNTALDICAASRLYMLFKHVWSLKSWKLYKQYLKIRLLPYRNHRDSIIHINRLMKFRGKILDYPDNHLRHIHALCEQSSWSI
jgi:hypothetical protein